MLKWLWCVLISGHNWEKRTIVQSEPQKLTTFKGSDADAISRMVLGETSIIYFCSCCGEIHKVTCYGVDVK